jgi:hypothetical protein
MTITIVTGNGPILQYTRCDNGTWDLEMVGHGGPASGGNWSRRAMLRHIEDLTA